MSAATSSAVMLDATHAASTVTLVLTDGRVYTGTLTVHPTDPALYVVRTGRRGRPAFVSADDVDRVIYE